MEGKKGGCPIDREKSKSGWGRKLTAGMLLLVLVVSGTGLLGQEAETKRQQEQKEQLSALAAVKKTEEPEETPGKEEYVSPIDFQTLKQENPDTVGWIRIPDTSIDYPILWDPDSNDTYLTTDFYGKESVYGAIFLDADSRPDFSGWNHPIYGHHMRDGSMFKDVVKFKDPEYFEEHRFFQIYTPERTIHLKALACYAASSDGIVRETRFRSQEEYDRWVLDRLEPCSFREVPDPPFPPMYVLVTCSYEFDDARTVLFAIEDKGKKTLKN